MSMKRLLAIVWKAPHLLLIGSYLSGMEACASCLWKRQPNYCPSGCVYNMFFHFQKLKKLHVCRSAIQTLWLYLLSESGIGGGLCINWSNRKVAHFKRCINLVNWLYCWHHRTKICKNPSNIYLKLCLLTSYASVLKWNIVLFLKPFLHIAQPVLHIYS